MFNLKPFWTHSSQWSVAATVLQLPWFATIRIVIKIDQLRIVMINKINDLSVFPPDEQDLVTAWATPALEMAWTKLASLPSNIAWTIIYWSNMLC